jgi:hypothetical protein
MNPEIPMSVSTPPTSYAHGTATNGVRALDIRQKDAPATMTTSGRIAPRKPPAPNYTTMDPVSLEAEIRQLEYDRTAGNPRGKVWRLSAGTALSHKVAWLHLAKSELERRQKLFQLDGQRLIDGKRALMFVEAAKTSLPEKDFRSIWALAKSTNPNDPAWREKP